MNPLLKKQLQGSIFFLFAAAFGALIVLMNVKTLIESGISSHYFLLDNDALSYNSFKLTNYFGEMFTIALLLFFGCMFIYTVYSFYEEKGSATGCFVAFIPVKKASAYFYKWICGVFIIAAAFIITLIITAVIILFYKTDIDTIYGYYNNAMGMNTVYFSFADNAFSIFIYILFIFCACLAMFSFVMFAVSSFGKIIHSVIFVLSVPVLGFAALFISSYYVYPNFLNAPEPQLPLLQPLFESVMSFYRSVYRLLALHSELYVFNSPNSNTMLLSDMQYTNTSYFIGIAICLACSGLFFLLGKIIYGKSEISRTDKVFMVDSLKIPAVLYAFAFSFIFLAMLVVMGTDTILY